MNKHSAIVEAPATLAQLADDSPCHRTSILIIQRFNARLCQQGLPGFTEFDLKCDLYWESSSASKFVQRIRRNRGGSVNFKKRILVVMLIIL